VAFRVLNQVIATVYHDQPPIIVGDSGCTLRSGHDPYKLIDVSYNLGSAVNIAAGMSEMGAVMPVIAILGDGSFFNSGINGIINAVRNKTQLVLVIFDNDTSATSGFQPTAGSTYGLKEEAPKRISIEEIIRACKVDLLRVVDPENETRTRQIFSEALAVDGIRVIILRSPCPLIP
jgi:indolepyruvate ferredoxin oxidoreductase alpha subunit